jgi:hypothetical protein
MLPFLTLFFKSNSIEQLAIAFCRQLMMEYPAQQLTLRII